MDYQIDLLAIAISNCADAKKIPEHFFSIHIIGGIYIFLIIDIYRHIVNILLFKLVKQKIT